MMFQFKRNSALLFLVILSLSFLISGCTNTANTTDPSSTSIDIKNVDRLEIIYFHGTLRCYSCMLAGEFTNETINTHFKDELDSGVLVFKQVNLDLPENAEIVSKYGASGSSLWFGVHGNDNKFFAEQNTNVWYKINDKEEYITYLTELINKKLEGN